MRLPTPFAIGTDCSRRTCAPRAAFRNATLAAQKTCENMHPGRHLLARNPFLGQPAVRSPLLMRPKLHLQWALISVRFMRICSSVLFFPVSCFYFFFLVRRRDFSATKTTFTCIVGISILHTSLNTSGKRSIEDGTNKKNPRPG